MEKDNQFSFSHWNLFFSNEYHISRFLCMRHVKHFLNLITFHCPSEVVLKACSYRLIVKAISPQKWVCNIFSSEKIPIISFRCEQSFTVLISDMSKVQQSKYIHKLWHHQHIFLQSNFSLIERTPTASNAFQLCKESFRLILIDEKKTIK